MNRRRAMSKARRVLTTERLQLEPIALAHARGLWNAVDASLDELRPWMAWTADASEAANNEFVAGAHQGWGTSSWVFTIIYAGAPAGTIGIDRHQPLLHSAEIGYWLRSDLAGRGLMTEAGRATVDFAFGELEIHRLELQAGVDNVASIRVAEKLGFRRAGLLRHGSRNAYDYYDVFVFDLLATDIRPVERAR
jgi:ribosomal-protein-serine acetyltransferase